ncbi:MAG: hypothetical protein L2C94_005290 [Aigarchaeota archaeon]|nr:hypothetical protein [Candidatus Wolframiiraptor gerlachensis]
MGLPDFKTLAAEVYEAIRVLESGDLAECIERCRRIVAEVRGSRAFGHVSKLVEPFLRHVDEYGLPSGGDREIFVEELREYLGLLGMALRELAGEEVEGR